MEKSWDHCAKRIGCGPAATRSCIAISYTLKQSWSNDRALDPHAYWTGDHNIPEPDLRVLPPPSGHISCLQKVGGYLLALILKSPVEEKHRGVSNVCFRRMTREKSLRDTWDRYVKMIVAVRQRLPISIRQLSKPLWQTNTWGLLSQPPKF